MVVGNVDNDSGNRAEIVVNFPGIGVWTWTNNASWSFLHPFVPESLAGAR